MKAYPYPRQTFITDSVEGLLQIVCHNEDGEQSFIMNDRLSSHEAGANLPRNWEFTPSPLFP